MAPTMGFGVVVPNPFLASTKALFIQPSCVTDYPWHCLKCLYSRKITYNARVKITQEEVTRILNKLIDQWKTNDLVKGIADEFKLKTALNDTFMKSMKAEDDLNKEVEQMLSKYEKQFERGELDRRKMFQMIKNQLAKDKKIIL